jgi:hypothetical protein
LPRAALACPICFGQNDSPLALGVNMGVWFMLGITGAVLSAFAGFFMSLIRKAHMVDQNVERSVGAEPAADGDRREGIASC